MRPDSTPAQRRRFGRDLAIIASVRAGLSLRSVAAVHGLSPARVHAIYALAQSRLPLPLDGER